MVRREGEGGEVDEFEVFLEELGVSELVVDGWGWMFGGMRGKEGVKFGWFEEEMGLNLDRREGRW